MTRKYELRAGLAAALYLTLVLAPLSLAAAETQMRTMTIGGDDATAMTMIAELGALVMEIDSTLKVAHVMEAQMRMAAYKDVDLQQDDIILMVNGKRTRTVADLDTLLAVLKPGDEIKMGVRRGKEMRMVSFAKADPEDLPKVQMMTMTMGGEEGEGGDGEGWHSSGGEGKMVTRTIGGNMAPGDIVMLMGSGLIARKSDDGPVIASLMPHAAGILGSTKVAEGDRIIKLQGKAVKSAKNLQLAWDAIDEGDEVEMTLTHDGKEYTLSFKRDKTPGNIIMKSE
jgi:S1-C subfamily serine protease